MIREYILRPVTEGPQVRSGSPARNRTPGGCGTDSGWNGAKYGSAGLDCSINGAAEPARASSRRFETFSCSQPMPQVRRSAKAEAKIVRIQSMLDCAEFLRATLSSQQRRISHSRTDGIFKPLIRAGLHDASSQADKRRKRRDVRN